MRRSVRMILGVLFLATLALGGCKKEEQQSSTPEHAPAAQSNPTPTSPPAATPPGETPKVAKLTAKLPGDGQPLMGGEAIQLPIIAWGADFPWVYCAGGTDGTRQGTICAKHGINIRIVKGDDYAGQLADYRARRTPLLRNTLGTIGKYWETLCKEDPGLCPRPWFMESKSKGDFLVCREHVKDVASLVGGCKDNTGNPRKCKIAAMKDGPWDKFLVSVVMEDAKGQWSDVEMVWVKNLSGETDSGDAVFRNDPSVDCTMAITPDMFALTGGVTAKGNGADNTVPGAHVVTSTFHRRDAGIIDGFAVSTEWSVKNGQLLHTMLAAYEEASEELMRLSRAYNGGGGSLEYEQAMAAMVAVYPTELKGDREEANGLYLDAGFLGIAGNAAFFDEAGAVGVKYHEKWANTTAKLLGTAQGDVKFGSSPIDWNHSAFSRLASRSARLVSKFKGEATAAQIEAMSKSGTIGENTMLRFSAQFAENEVEIKDCSPYHEAFKNILEAGERDSTAPIVIRAHYDPSRLIAEIMMAGIRSGAISQQGTPGNYTYFAGGEPLSLQSVQPWLKLLNDPNYQGAVDSQGNALTLYIDQARTDSQKRADALKTCMLDYAKAQGKSLDPNRLVTEAAGMSEPIVVKARSPEQAAANRRAECALVKATGEGLTDSMYEL